MHRIGFFLNEWKKLSESERVKTFGATSDYPLQIMAKKLTLDELIQMPENTNFLNIPKSTQDDLIKWGNEMRDAYLANVNIIYIKIFLGFI